MRDNVAARAICKSRDHHHHHHHEYESFQPIMAETSKKPKDFISGAERRFRLDRGYYYPDDTWAIYRPTAQEGNTIKRCSLFKGIK
jgi:hypothetical protein